MKVSTFVPFLLSAIPLCQAAPLRGSSWTGWDGIEYLFVFGDSYTQTGFDPTGEQPNPSNPFGNPPFPGWTSSNGPNWIDFLATTHNQSYIRTYNLAYGGATVDSDLVPPYTATVLSLKNQVQDQFIPIYGSHPDSASWSAENTLFAVFIGINDVGSTFWDKDDALYDEILTVYRDLINQIHESGGQNFLFLNVPPIDRSPMVIAQGEQGQELADAAIQDFNNRISALAADVETSYERSRVFQFDTHALYSAVLDDPASHGETAVYKDVTTFCEEYQNGTPDWYTLIPECGIAVHEYFWLNDLHPTFPVHNATAREAAALFEQA